jgi:hypothetical protein
MTRYKRVRSKKGEKSGQSTVLIPISLRQYGWRFSPIYYKSVNKSTDKSDNYILVSAPCASIVNLYKWEWWRNKLMVEPDAGRTGKLAELASSTNGTRKATLTTCSELPFCKMNDIKIGNNIISPAQTRAPIYLSATSPFSIPITDRSPYISNCTWSRIAVGITKGTTQMRRISFWTG